MIGNRLTKLFEKKERDLLSIFFTAGYPKLEDTARIAHAIKAAGVDFVEIGIPFSDPVADGPTIQRSSEIALRNGMTLKLLFEQLAEIRRENDIPILLMGYVNPLLQFGVDRFCGRCAELGIDGVIVPDLPLEEFERRHRQTFIRNNLCNVLLISPETSPERIRLIDRASTGFLYVVSSSSTTGKAAAFGEAHRAYLERIEKMNLTSPRMVGFGISDRSSFEEVCRYANGAIVGSAFIRAIDSDNDLERSIPRFIESIRPGGSHGH